MGRLYFQNHPMKKLISLLAVLVFGFTSYHLTANEDVTWAHIATYSIGKWKFNVNAIPEWQAHIYNQLGIPLKTQLLLRTVQQLECNQINGFCLNSSDGGPFQINQIHWQAYKHTAQLIKEWRAHCTAAEKTGNWNFCIKTRNELFEYQARWTWERMKRFSRADWYDWLSREKQVWHQAVLHNGNTRMLGTRQFRYYYADKAVAHWKILDKFYKKNDTHIVVETQKALTKSEPVKTQKTVTASPVKAKPIKVLSQIEVTTDISL